MRVKLDENLPSSVADVFREHGIDAVTVHEEGLAGRDDSIVFAAATSEDRMLFTLDRGFGDIRVHPPGTHPGIVVFRLRDDSTPAVVTAVRRLLAQHDLAEFTGSITVVHAHVLRIRRDHA